MVNVPAANGLALATTLPLFRSGLCAPLGIVDFNWFDQLLRVTILPALASSGVNPSNFPMFLLHNVMLAPSSVTNFSQCCIGGYHSAHGLPVQTYSAIDFESTRLFTTSLSDTAIAAHEVAEWMDDPFGDNQVPLWGHIGQQRNCQNNLEVGDPLGVNAPPIVMANGFTYHLQELPFFSWFFGAPSIGIHGWFSNNGTFLTDAGPVCQQ